MLPVHLAFLLTALPLFQEGAPLGSMLTGLTADERESFFLGRKAFLSINSVQGERYFPDTEAGLGPLYNLDSCGGCHAYPEPGGSSPAKNPQFEAARRHGAVNAIPGFLETNGPALQVRRRGDRGGIHPLFSIAGRKDAGNCGMHAMDFNDAHRKNQLVFRIPAPLYGAGYISAIASSEIVANAEKDREAKRALGIRGEANLIEPGVIGRFGWKAHLPSLELFSAEAYRNEQGVTNEYFPDELTEGTSGGCELNPVPEDKTVTGRRGTEGMSNVLRFANFARFLAPPPGPSASESEPGRRLFAQTGCALCHTPVLITGPSSYQALAHRDAALYSDLLIHRMGAELSDGVVQGRADGQSFRTAPLWGVGRRLYLLHDGRARTIEQAILIHGRGADSEAAGSVGRYRALSANERHILYDFLRHL